MKRKPIAYRAHWYSGCTDFKVHAITATAARKLLQTRIREYWEKNDILIDPDNVRVIREETDVMPIYLNNLLIDDDSYLSGEP
jgi:hypothetical protein